MRFKDILTAVRDADGREDPAKIRAAIEIENQAIASGRARRDAAEREQDQALLDGDGDCHRKLAGEIADIEFREKTAQERLPLLAERLRAADEIKLQAAIKIRRTELVAMYAKVRSALENLVDVNVAAIALFELCRNEFGERVTAENFARIHYPGIALPDIASAWIAEMNRTMSTTPKPAKMLTAPATFTRRPIVAHRDRGLTPTVSNAHQAVSLADVPVTPPKSKRQAPPAPVEGGVAIQVLRSGVEIGGYQATAGEQLVLERDVAHQLLRAGVADSVPEAANA